MACRKDAGGNHCSVMFELFGNKNKHFVGVDFGTSSLKIVQLSRKNGQVWLDNYAVVDLAWMGSSPVGARGTFEEKIVLSLKTAIHQSGIKTDGLNIGLPGFIGLITIIQFPKMSPDEMANAIKFEAHRYIPSSMGDMAISWEILKKKIQQSTPEEKEDILLVAAPKKEIAKYEHIVEAANLSVGSIELETFAIARALSFGKAGSFLIVDMGARATNMVFVQDGIVRVNRNIGVGGYDVTEAIADAMNISPQRAESMKRGSRDLLNSKEKISIPALQLLTEEISRFLRSYKERYASDDVGGIFLSGGASGMQGLNTYMTNILGTPVTVANPWKNIHYDPKLESHIGSLGSGFSVAIGLAMREMEEASGVAQ